MRNLFLLTTCIAVNVAAGGASTGDTPLKQPQPTMKPIIHPQQAGDPRESATTPDLEALVRALGTPITFDSAFTELQNVPRFKDEFETAAEFQQRQAAALQKLPARYLIEAPVDLKYVRYDADRQVLVIETYALTNTLASHDELWSVFGLGSELNEAGIEVKYSILSNVMWAFPREQQDVGTYEGTNALGVKRTITKQEGISRGIFEREGAYQENVWEKEDIRDTERSAPIAFEIKADRDKARALKQGRLRSAVLVVPRSPFYGKGVDHFTPTIQAPYDRTTSVRYLIGDIQCTALYDAEGKLLATRATR